MNELHLSQNGEKTRAQFITVDEHAAARATNADIGDFVECDNRRKPYTTIRQHVVIVDLDDDDIDKFIDLIRELGELKIENIN